MTTTWRDDTKDVDMTTELGAVPAKILSQMNLYNSAGEVIGNLELQNVYSIINKIKTVYKYSANLDQLLND
jgi:hypothetical protein